MKIPQLLLVIKIDSQKKVYGLLHLVEREDLLLIGLAFLWDILICLKPWMLVIPAGMHFVWFLLPLINFKRMTFEKKTGSFLDLNMFTVQISQFLERKNGLISRWFM